MQLAGPEKLTTIYDLGANLGTNLPYYLSRAEKVVAVEGNPALVAAITERYSSELESGRLRLVGCVLSDQASDEVPFYVHRRNHLLSQAEPPSSQRMGEFDPVMVPSRQIVDIIESEGMPDFLKVDLEGYDHVVLDQLFRASIFPVSLSVECHSLLPFALIENTGQYKSFQLMDPRRFDDLPLPQLDPAISGSGAFSFGQETAGPFGDDIPYPWMNSRQCLMNLAIEGLGWRDLHARMDPPDRQARVWMEHLPLRALAGGLARKLSGVADGPSPVSPGS